MKKFIEASRKKIIEKLKFISSIMDLVANILKSFAMIIGSGTAVIIASISGYREVKKMTRKELVQTPQLEVKKEVVAGASSTRHNTAPSNNQIVTTANSAEVPVSYYFDMNSGAFLLSVIFLGFLLFKKLTSKKSENKS